MEEFKMKTKKKNELFSFKGYKTVMVPTYINKPRGTTLNQISVPLLQKPF